jgi:hypothetical protein
MINSVSSQTRYGTPDSGRPCGEPGCTTVLSTYNASDRCYLHAAPSFRHPLYRD